MAEGQSPENSPPAPPPPSPSSPSSNDQTTSPPPTSDSQTTSSPPPSPTLAPPPEQSPPPPENSSSPPPPPYESSTPSSQSQSPPLPSQSPPQQSDNKGNNQGNDGGGNNASPPPPPPSKTSEHSSHSPPKSLAPPTSNGGSNSSSNDRPNMGVVIGLVAAAGLLFLVMILLCVCCLRKKKKKSKIEQMPYYGSNAFAPDGGDQYFNNAATQQQQHYNQNDNTANLPPPPGTMGTNWVNSPPPPPPGNWQPMPSPPAPVSGGANAIHSNEMSSNYSSGPYAPSLPPPHPSVALGFNKSTFTYEELAAATQGFSKDHLLGQGGFGYVHKGVLPNGKEIAVKSLKAGSGQGDREFQAEVDIISRVHHRHLVSLVGYCSNSGGQRLLVYEFLPNDTLEFHLHVIGKTGTVMDWPTRLKIALGSAKGLAYLHEDCHPKIIHRDIKASNILLDLNFEAKVADFGLAKLSQDNNTHVSTRVMGTFGYLAPEYAASGKLTDKSDVFSFGIMLLELITGRRPVDLSGEMEDSLVDWARPLCMNAAQDGEYGELVDPFLENQYEPYEMARMVACAAAAVRHSGRRRPKMSQIVRILEGDASLDDLNDGVKPGQGSYMGSSGGDGSSDYETGTYGAEMKKFRKVTLDSRDYGASSEYGGTSEYGLDPSSSSSEEMNIGGGSNKTTTTSTRRV
ncbi:proline-rich receptor-like protein kinase PERK7 isoform X3 [Brassica rapa]|uniref:proline-rich receptor-like protein kinase PERK7 isoform X3 n=1 Tax=Brassica campestris TaxID=3711 RepID=UPI0008734B99|nr:proline-rich receptor-like protein kinase PERK7 isoform X3 [Brassica rapa]